MEDTPATPLSDESTISGSEAAISAGDETQVLEDYTLTPVAAGLTIPQAHGGALSAAPGAAARVARKFSMMPYLRRSLKRDRNGMRMAERVANRVVRLATDRKTPPGVQIAAASLVFDRIDGKAPQSIALQVEQVIDPAAALSKLRATLLAMRPANLLGCIADTERSIGIAPPTEEEQKARRKALYAQGLETKRRNRAARLARISAATGAALGVAGVGGKENPEVGEAHATVASTTASSSATLPPCDARDTAPLTASTMAGSPPPPPGRG